MEDGFQDDTFSSMKMLAYVIIIGTILFSAAVSAALILFLK